MKEVLAKAESKMGKTIARLESDYAAIRAGRANPAVLDKVMVDYYGAPTPVNQLAAVSVAEARVLTIQPWDGSVCRAIERAIQTSDIGINPQSDGKTIRLIFPPLTEEKRKDIVKDVSHMAEEAKIALRSIRRDAMEKLKAMSEKIAGERADLETQMDDLNAAKDELAVQQAELETQRAESDELLIQMAKEYESMSAEYADYEAMEDELSAQIAKSETDYFNALSREEAARIAAAAKNNTGSSSASGSSGSASASGFVFPMAYATKITDAYGYRIHPLSGTKKWHNGVDLAAGSGTAIYATQSGTVTSACYNEAYGNMVTINHGDGYSSLYGHMTNYIVSVGDTVSAGQTIGYVGSTGWSTGPHLHFTIYYNGSDVNPLNYVSMP